VPIRSGLAHYLEQHKRRSPRPNPQDLFFVGKGGHPLDPARFYRRAYLPAVKAADLRMITMHDLRVTFVTQCAEAGIPLAVIARWVGHSATRTTEIYRQSTPHAEDKALSLLHAYDTR
jgi:integrase